MMDQILQSLQSTLAGLTAFLPNLVASIVILLAGWIIAAILGRATNSVLEKIGFDDLIKRAGIKETLAEHGSQFDPSRIVGSIVFWAVLITTFLLTANVLGLTAVSALLTRLVAFLPIVAVAVIAVVVAVALAQITYDAIIALLGDSVEGSKTIAAAARWGIIAFGVFVALSQLQVAPTIVNGLFLALTGSLALAFAISFGLGNVELAKKITSDWYDNTWTKTQAKSQGQPQKGESKKRPAA